MWYKEPTTLVLTLAFVATILLIYASIQYSRREAADLDKAAKQIATDKYHTDMAMVDAAKGSPFPSEPAPRVVVNIPPDFKPIQPLPGDTSLDGQKALLWYSVFKEALDQMHDGEWATSSQVDRAREVANAAVEACYGANPTGLPNT